MAKPNWNNRTLFHNDNLGVMRAMNSESVDLIATDPPFNKSKDFHATPDTLASGASFQDRWTWERDVHEDWLDQLKDDQPNLMNVIQSARLAHSDSMGAFLCFMALRSIEMHRVLKPTGSIYLHCDPTASHYLKLIMDALFGRANFKNDIVWRRATSHNDASRYGNNTDRLLFYGRSETITWNGEEISIAKTDDELKKAYPMKDARGKYRSADLTGPSHGYSGGESSLPWSRYDVRARGRVWSVPLKGNYAVWIEKNIIPGYRSIQGIHDRLDALDKAGLINHPKKGVWPGLKRYADAETGNPAQALILDIPGFTNYNNSEESTGYPTQKPLALYERIIKASSNEGDVVLDPFAGCATTCVAAEKLGRQWVGIDIWDKAPEVVVERFNKIGIFNPKRTKRSRKTQQQYIFAEDFHFTSEFPERTDDRETAAPFLRVKVRIKEPEGQKMSRTQMYEHLLTQHGSKCQGCNRMFDDPRYLELDHNIPRSDGGINHVTNRILLCGPCNKLKSNIYTLSGLRRENRRRGYMQSLKASLKED